jgi:membrane protein
MDDRLSRTVRVFRAIIHEARAEKITFMAGSIAYHAFVSLLPLLVLLLIVVSSIGDRTLEQSLIAITQTILTPGADDVLVNEIKQVRQSTSLSLIGIAVLLWGPLRIFRGLDTAFSDIYETERQNTLTDQASDSIVVLLTFGLSIIVAAIIETVIPSYGSSFVAWLAQQLLLVVGLAFTFFPIYYIFPDTDVSGVEVLPGILIAAVGITVFSSLFDLYLQFSARSADGTLVANVVLLLTWLYFSGLVLLLGVIVNAVLSGRSHDVSIDPVIGSRKSEHSNERDLKDRTELVDEIEQLEDLLDDAEEVVVTVDDEQVALSPPQRVQTDTSTDGSWFGLRNGLVGIELKWWLREE